MLVLEHLLACLKEDLPVRSVQVGNFWTAVCSRHCGLASIPDEIGSHGTRSGTPCGHYGGMTARQLADYARSDVPLEASLGVAALNSLLEVDLHKTQEINALEILIQRGQGKKVALVGHFPFVPQLQAAVNQLWVLELRPRPGDYPADAAPDIIPQADIVAITSSTLINHTLDGLLALCRPQALVVMLGPSTPLSPVLFEHGVDILSGVVVVDEAAAMRSIRQGASLKEMLGVRLVTLLKTSLPR